MLELIKLYVTFFKLGIVNFGGGYAMLPLLERELADKRGWTTAEELADYYAVGQCTPGAIAVNVSTMIGYKRKGVLGGIAATLGFISPAFVIIFIIATLLTNFADNKYVAHALAGIRVVVFFLVLSAIIKLFKNSCKDKISKLIAILVGVLAIVVPTKYVGLYMYVIVAGVFGVVFNLIKEKKRLKKENENPSDEKLLNEKMLETVKEKTELINALAPKNLEQESEEAIEPKPKRKLGRGAIGIIIACAMLASIMVVSALVYVFKDSAIFFKLYFQFFKIGALAFGGGLATIPFLSELSELTGWFSAEDLANMIAVSESTPGAMGINMSTYVGYTVIHNEFGNYFLSFVGSMISTLGLVTPSIIVIEIIALFLNKFKNNKYVDWAFYGLRAASIGLMIAAAYSICEVSLMQNSEVVEVFKSAFDGISIKTFFPSLGDAINNILNWKNIAVGVVFGITIFKYKKHPILYIAIGAVVGILLWL
ncbi:MAG: chromate transporter [Acholeplasmatales bacterium]|nr:chromate transporter [Acholeplasmatales bacterium]